MSFIFTLAHWCEVHGPTSILCTQAVASACSTCHTGSRPSYCSSTPPSSSDGSGSIQSRAATGASLATGIPSPAETPPASPRSTSLSLPNAGASAATTAASESCRNCSISFPKNVTARHGGSGASTPGSRTASPTSNGSSDTTHIGQRCRSIRSTQTISVGIPEEESEWHHSYDQERDLPRSAYSVSDTGTFSPRQPVSHEHTITYLSDRHPSTPALYSAVRSSCVRTFTCESVPGQTGPFMFGDPLAGYTLAYVFRIQDRKARGGVRTYALLCLCPDQRALMKSWGFVEMTFDRLIKQIRQAAERHAAEDNSAAAVIDLASGPDGFLRSRAPPGGGVGAKNLAEVCGLENLFFFIHQTFGWLLIMLAQAHGFPPEAGETTLEAGARRGRTASISSTDARSWSPTRSGHIPPSIDGTSSTKTITPQDTRGNSTSTKTTLSPKKATDEALARKTAAMSVADPVKSRSSPAGHSRTASTVAKARREREERRGNRSVAVGH